MDAAARVVDQGLSGTGGGSGSPIARCEGEASSESDVAACEVCCASAEMERARAATHSAVALRRAQAAGESESRNGCQDVEHVPGDVGRKIMENSEFTTAHPSHSCGHGSGLPRCRGVGVEASPKPPQDQGRKAPPAACRARPKPGRACPRTSWVTCSTRHQDHPKNSRSDGVSSESVRGRWFRLARVT